MTSTYEQNDPDHGAAMTNRPLVSIAMCTYNGERFLREQLDSLVQQDYRPLEIQIFDDRSTDRTYEILKEYETEYDFIHAHKNETNLGFIRNFETAIGACSGDFIALCDQDDVWFPHKISTLINEIGDHTLIYSHTSLIDSENQPQGDFLPNTIRISGKANRALILGNCVTGHTCLFPRSLLKTILPFPEGIDYHDHWIAFAAATTGELRYLDKPLSSYRRHENNVSINLPGKKIKKLFKSPRELLERNRKKRMRLKSRYDRLTAWSTLDILSGDDRQLIQTIAKETKRSFWKRYNRRLHRLLQNHPELLDVYKNKETAVRHCCRGTLFRF
jgi:glycosyltransferase involved in cell wall biosynthesis